MLSRENRWLTFKAVININVPKGFQNIFPLVKYFPSCCVIPINAFFFHL